MNIFFSCVKFFFFFSPLLTHHLQSGRRCESSFTTENLALKKKKNQFFLFYSRHWLGRRKHDRFGSVFLSSRIASLFHECLLWFPFCLRWAGLFCFLSFSLSFFFFGLFPCSRIDRMCRAWHSPSSRRLADSTMQTHVAACVRTPWRCRRAVDGVSSPAGCVFLRVPVIAPLWTCASGDKWPTGDVSGSSKGGGRGGLSRLTSCSAPSSYRSASILFSSCQNSQLPYWLEFITPHFYPVKQQSQSKEKLLAGGICQNASETSVFIKSKAAASRECWWAILQGGCELSGWKPYAGPLGGKNTGSIILAKAAGASCYGMKTLKNTVKTRCIIWVIYCLECTGGKKNTSFHHVAMEWNMNGRQASLDILIFNKSYMLLCVLCFKN